jgi:hypothetical protein
VPLIIQSLGYKIEWSSAMRADMVIYGSFYDVSAPRLRWLPRSWRKKAVTYLDALEQELSKRRIAPLTLFHTAENLRHDHIKADYAISHDLNVQSGNHFRLPYWMEMIDWSHEGIIGNSNSRYGELLKLERLQAPLGDQFLRRDQKAIFITSHLREPRATCYGNLKKLMPVDGMGPYFDQSIKNHHKSTFLKKDILANYAFNLCPENSIHPGYVTEKIPEAFAAGCLPIAYVDTLVSLSFNPKAFINLASFKKNDIESIKNIFLSQSQLTAFADEPLIIDRPNIMDLKKFINKVLLDI